MKKSSILFNTETLEIFNIKGKYYILEVENRLECSVNVVSLDYIDVFLFRDLNILRLRNYCSDKTTSNIFSKYIIKTLMALDMFSYSKISINPKHYEVYGYIYMYKFQEKVLEL